MVLLYVAAVTSSRRWLRRFLGQPPLPELTMVARVRLLYGQLPPETSFSELSLSASEVVEIWDAWF
jgi:hypothetical protein